MLVFLDFEASSLSERSYPIEVGWIFENGDAEAHLIKPAPTWTDWSSRAAAVHGISRELLKREGTAHEEVARRLVDVLSGHQLFASAPSWDGKWLSVLLRAGGYPRHSLRLRDTAEAQKAAAKRVLIEKGIPATDLAKAVRAVVYQARIALAAQPTTHRALADAERERLIWAEAGNLAARWPTI
jgi:hypothetical protein